MVNETTLATGLVMDPTTAINTAAAVDDNSFFTFFPEDVFGPIPDLLRKLLVDTGFDRLATFVTITSDDVDDLEKECEVKLKLGHKRLLSQMVEHGKYLMINKKSDHVHKKHSTASMPAASNVLGLETLSKKRDKFQEHPVNNVKEVLMQSIQKTIRSFCKTNRIDSFSIAELNLLQSKEGNSYGAEIICVCGEKVKVYITRKKNNSITSNMLR
ncbi:hypothetical protein Bhyg_13276, partial [Pseudolycoriella hygida]